MKFLKRIKAEKQFLASGYALVAAGVGFVLSLVSLIACGNFYLYAMLCLPRNAPPQLLFYVLFVFLAVLIGYVCGMVHAYRGNDRCKFSGSVFAALSALFLLLWYIAFFRTFSFVFSLFLLILSLLLLLLAVKELCHVGILPVLAAGIAAIIHLFFLWLTVAVILLN